MSFIAGVLANRLRASDPAMKDALDCLRNYWASQRRPWHDP